MRLLRIRHLEGSVNRSLRSLRPSAISASKQLSKTQRPQRSAEGCRGELLPRGAFSGFFLVFVLGDALGEGVAVDAEDGGRVGDVFFVTGERFLDVELLEFAERFVEKDVAFEHFVDQVFETVVNQSSFPVSSL